MSFEHPDILGRPSLDANSHTLQLGGFGVDASLGVALGEGGSYPIPLAIAQAKQRLCARQGLTINVLRGSGNPSSSQRRVIWVDFLIAPAGKFKIEFDTILADVTAQLPDWQSYESMDALFEGLNSALARVTIEWQ